MLMLFFEPDQKFQKGKMFISEDNAVVVLQTQPSHKHDETFPGIVVQSAFESEIYPVANLMVFDKQEFREIKPMLLDFQKMEGTG